jgi:iron complex transport system substrate-binding protein
LGQGVKKSLIILLFLFLLTPGNGAAAATFTDEVGRKVDATGVPQRIISVAPSITETLFALGLGDRVVGVSSYCKYPPEALKKEKIGGYVNPSLEKIVALKPDLVVAIAEGDLKAFVDKLAGLKIPVFIVNPADVFGVLTSIQNIGKATYSSRAAQKLTRTMEERIRAVQKKTQGRPRPRVLQVLSMDPLLSVGKGTFVDDLIRLGGGRNVAEDAAGKYPRLSMEEVLAQNPEVILLASMNSQDEMAEERRYWQRWKTLAAARNGRIHAIDSDLILRPSPRIVDGLEEVARAIHPGAFQ